MNPITPGEAHGPNGSRIFERWLEQCQAARGIREGFGPERALGYLLGEKMMEVLRLADSDSALSTELPRFAAEVGRIFTPEELQAFFTASRGVGPLAHMLDSSQIDELRSAGVIEEDMETALQDAIRFERMRRLLLPDE